MQPPRVFYDLHTLSMYTCTRAPRGPVLTPLPLISNGKFDKFNETEVLGWEGMEEEMWFCSTALVAQSLWKVKKLVCLNTKSKKMGSWNILDEVAECLSWYGTEILWYHLPSPST